MTLREEIETVLDNVWGDVEISGGTDVKEYADEILKLFEKLIDEKILSMECWKAEYQLNDKEFQTILQILKEFKEELKK
jgi:hypothetical protein